MERVFKFIRKPGEAGQGKIFTHYWNNNMNNAFDDYSIEAYLSREYSHYKWEPTEAEDLNKTNLFYATLTISGWDEPVIFLKVETGEYDDQGIWTNTEIPTYYFGTELNSQTLKTETVVKTVYQLELDLWATVGWRFHLWTKQDFNEDVLAFRKMCDRFMFNTLLGIGFSLDYRLQPYLMQTLNYNYPLIKDNTENSLTLNEWLYINSGEQRFKTMEDWLPIWYEWLNNPWCAPFWANDKGPYEGTTSYLDYFQNYECTSLIGRESASGFNDSDYNSNGKYKWLVIKTGNNTSTKLAHNPVFPKTQRIQIRQADGGIPFFTVPQGQFTYEENDTFIYDQTYGGYAITQTYKGTIDPEQSFVGKKVIFHFEDKLFNTNYIKMQVLNTQTYFVNSFWIDNKLSRRLKNVEIDSFSFGVEYTIVEFEQINIIYSKEINIKVTPYITFALASDGTLTFKFRLYVENDLELGFTLLDYEFSIKNQVTFSTNVMSTYMEDTLIGAGDTGTPYYLTGEELMYIPIKKGVDGYEFIHRINSDSTYDEQTQKADGNVILSSGNVLGMPINDIPPSVLAMALRNFANESETQPIGDRIAARESVSMSPNKCPLALLNFYSATNGSDDEPYETPVIVNSLDYIPVNIAMSPQMFREYNIIGGTNFFNYFFDLLTNEYLTNNMEMIDPITGETYIHGGNTMESEPLLYGPQFWQWIYLIDGAHRIALTPDMIDFDKFIMKDWTVKLNVNMTDTTHYKLDISDIRSDIYPFTKSTSELISVDSITHPYSTEGFNNYMAYNQYTQETSKNAKDVQNYWAQKNLPIYQAGAVIGGFGEGIAGGAAGGGIWGAVAGGIGGLIGGATEAITMKYGLENKISMVNELWNNQWRGTYGNIYSQPSSLNPSGFGSGSLLYSGVASAKTNEYETFRTYRIVDLARKEIWNDISSNGYIFRSQCKYADYDNRINFNMVNMSFDEKEAMFDEFLRQKIGEVSTMFSQQQFIDWFKMICKKGFRLWKKEPTNENINELIETNIENNYVRPWIPLSGYVVLDYNLPVFGVDSELSHPDLFKTDYEMIQEEKSSVPTGNYLLTKKDNKLTQYSIDIPYTYFGSKFVDKIVLNEETGYYENQKPARVVFMEGFSGIRLNNDQSSTSLYNKTTERLFSKIGVDIPYSSENILIDDLVYESGRDVYKTSEPVRYNTIADETEVFSTLFVAKNQDETDYVQSSGFYNGWDVYIELHPTQFNTRTGEITQDGFARITAKEYSHFLFYSPEKDIRGWNITKGFSWNEDWSGHIFDFLDTQWTSVNDLYSWANSFLVMIAVVVPIFSSKSCDSSVYGIEKWNGSELEETRREVSSWMDPDEYGNVTRAANAILVDNVNVEHIINSATFKSRAIDVLKTDISQINIMKSLNNKIVVNYNDKLSFDMYGGDGKNIDTTSGIYQTIEKDVSFSHEISLDDDFISQMKNDGTPYYFYNEVIVTTSHDGANVKCKLLQMYGLTYNKETELFELRRYTVVGTQSTHDAVEVRGNKHYFDISTRWVAIRNGASGTIPKFGAKFQIGWDEEFNKLMWAQENKLNSFIFPKTSLIDESTSYILKHEKKSK